MMAMENFTRSGVANKSFSEVLSSGFSSFLCCRYMGGSGTKIRMTMAMIAGITPTTNRPCQPKFMITGALISDAMRTPT